MEPALAALLHPPQFNFFKFKIQARLKNGGIIDLPSKISAQKFDVMLGYEQNYFQYQYAMISLAFLWYEALSIPILLLTSVNLQIMFRNKNAV